jgi:type IV secretory pathway VirD2 relaxase
LLGRAAKLERLGLAEQVGSGRWALKADIEQTLRDLSIRGDIIKTMHRAMTGAGREPDVSGFALHGDGAAEPVLGRLVARGLHDELKASAYAIVEGVDGRTHYLRFSDLEMTGDAKPGAIVEARVDEDAQSEKREFGMPPHREFPPKLDVSLTLLHGERGPRPLPPNTSNHNLSPTP